MIHRKQRKMTIEIQTQIKRTTLDFCVSLKRTRVWFYESLDYLIICKTTNKIDSAQLSFYETGNFGLVLQFFSWTFLLQMLSLSLSYIFVLSRLFVCTTYFYSRFRLWYLFDTALRRIRCCWLCCKKTIIIRQKDEHDNNNLKIHLLSFSIALRWQSWSDWIVKTQKRKTIRKPKTSWINILETIKYETIIFFVI